MRGSEAASGVGRLTVPAPAKLNLFLHVTGRREDGMHRLESVFVPLALSDRITFTANGTDRIRRVVDVPGVPEDDDLAVRAARALAARAGVEAGVDIAIEKRIPMGSGLGGGSSDAATVLRALDAWWGLELGGRALHGVACTLGADVPFFLGDGPAFARGIGDLLTPVTLAPHWVALVVPCC